MRDNDEDKIEIFKYFDYLIKKSYEENINIIYINSTKTKESIKITVEKSLIYYLSTQINNNHDKNQNLCDNFTTAVKINCIFVENIENKQGDYIIQINYKDFIILKNYLIKKEEMSTVLVSNIDSVDNENGFNILIK